MRPQKQLFRHDPAAGVYGDCHRTAVAIIFDLDAKDVPHFADTDSMAVFQEREERWLISRGYESEFRVYSGDHTLAEVLAQTAFDDGQTPLVLSGSSWRGRNHSIVVAGGKIICDPATGEATPDALIGPCTSGRWWTTRYVRLSGVRVMSPIVNHP